jgi:hypothetical protein
MSKRTRNLYAWKTRSEDGRKRQVEAQLFGAQWKFTSLCAGDEEWAEHDPPLLEDLEDLEIKVFNKYQRKHNSWDQVISVRKLIARHYPEAAQSDE